MHILYMLKRPTQLRGKLICAVKCACSTPLISKARHVASCLCLFIRTEVVMHTSACQNCHLPFGDAFIMLTAAVSWTIWWLPANWQLLWYFLTLELQHEHFSYKLSWNLNNCLFFQVHKVMNFQIKRWMHCAIRQFFFFYSRHLDFIVGKTRH